MNKEEALKKIEELKKFVEECDQKEKLSYVKGSTYAEALGKLSIDERPPTLKEIMEARIQQPELFGVYLDTCTAVIRKENSDLIKIVPMCEELINLPKGFNDSYLGVDYDSLEGVEVNKNDDKKILWLIAMGGDTEDNRKLYEEYKSALLSFNPDLDSSEVMNFYG